MDLVLRYLKGGILPLDGKEAKLPIHRTANISSSTTCFTKGDSVFAIFDAYVLRMVKESLKTCTMENVVIM